MNEDEAPAFNEPLGEPLTHAQLAARFFIRQAATEPLEEEPLPMPDDLY